MYETFTFIFFPHLSDREVIELFGTHESSTLSFDEFNRIEFNFLADADSNDLISCDPESNSLCDLVLTNSEYIHEQDFNNALFPSSSSGIMFHNINSIPHNLENLVVNSDLSSMESIKFLLFCETKLSEDIEHLYEINNYTLVTNSRNHYGGGVCMYIRNQISYKILSPMSIMCDHIETLFVDTYLGKKEVVIGVLYHRPNSNYNLFIESLENILQEISSTGKTAALIGDFNVNILNTSNSKVKQFISTFYSYGFYPCINKPTRVQNRSATIIDHIWINNVQIVLKSGILLTDVSDHFAPFICCAETSKSYEHLKFAYRDYKNADNNTLCQAIAERTMAINLNDNDTDFIADSISSAISTAVDETIPLKTVIIKAKRISKPWITPELLTHIKERQKLYKKFLKKPISLGTAYKERRNRVNNLIKEAKIQYYKSKFSSCEGNGKQTWKIINEITNRKKDHVKIEHITVNDTCISDVNDISNHFNTYFTNIGINLANQIPCCNISPLTYLTNAYPDFVPYNTTPEEITLIIKSLKDSAPGYDDIHMKVLKKAAPVIAPVLSTTINNSFQTGVFPTSLKVAKIIPIHKGGCTHDISNYRPISILPSLSKVYERVMYNRLVDFLDTHSILNNCQFGFRKKFSPKLALTKLTDFILQNLGKENFVVSVFLDLKKAFDTLDHKILLKKLNHYGIRGKTLQWFESFLCNRRQYTIIDNTNSTTTELMTGVPQGSTLGPLLFLLYINDIVETSEDLNFILFADDTNITLAGSNLCNLVSLLNHELSKVSTWLQSNKLSLNIEKTKYLVFAGKKQVNDIQVKICNKIIQRTNDIRYLGIHIDNMLNWNVHISHIHIKLSKSLGILHKIKHLLTTATLLTLYYSLFYPYLQYCNVVWGMANKTTSKSLITLQKRIIRVICKANWYDHTSPLFRSLKILKVHDIYKLECLKLIHSHRHGHITTQFVAAFQTHTANTRQRHNLRPAFPSLEIQKRFVMYYGCMQYNELPDHLKIIENQNTFKINTKKYLTNSY